LVFYTPLPFTACLPGSVWCEVAYFFTSSGGPIGFFSLLFITGIFYASSAQGRRAKWTVFFKSVITLALFFGALALLNERYTKPLLKLQRPSHVYMLSKTGLQNSIDSLYALDKPARRDFFAHLIRSNPGSFLQIDEDIQEHWIEEAGFSFPSGHSFNAFLFAMILAYAIKYNRSYPHLRILFFIPFLWAFLVAVSRVAVGAHSALDVSAGALLGICIGFVFLYIERTRHWLTRKN
jgi:phosphatidylglycerophosphatase B